MTFKLTVSDPFVLDEELNEYASLGFVIEDGSIVLVDYESFKDLRPTIEINTWDDLLALKAKIDQPIIVNSDTLEIYNGYRE